MRLLLSPAALLVLALPLAGCGDEPGETRPAITPYRGAGGQAPGRTDLYVGQEVWLTYDSPEHAQFPIRVARSKEDARKLSEALHARAVKGEDVGLMAQKHSNATGARAEGFTDALAMDRERLDERDRAIMAVREGEVTPIVDWRGGFWFARRITLAQAKPLAELYDRLVKQGEAAKFDRVRARIIHFHHAGAFPNRVQADKISKEQAIANARAVLRELQGGADFALAADRYSWDLSGDRGGILLANDPLAPRSTWIMRYDTGYPDSLLQVLFDAPKGLHPRPIVTPRGVVVAEILERKQVTLEELKATVQPLPASTAPRQPKATPSEPEKKD